MTGNRISNKKTLWEKKGGRTFHGDLDTGKYGETPERITRNPLSITSKKLQIESKNDISILKLQYNWVYNNKYPTFVT